MNIRVKTTMAFTVFGFLYTIGALMMPKAAVGNPIAPKIFPLILGIGLTILGSIYTAKEYKQWKEDQASGVKKEISLEKQAIEKSTNKLITLTAVSGIVYAAIFEHAGYVISTSLFIGAIMFAINGKKKWKVNLAVAIIFSVAVYFVFSNLLAIPLPKIPGLEI
ncbi:tripartite tricarboxylate transporter TctB family protein [uncultured Ilyobacter sp.]|uniref:tripartite tricarboxylate transporter TctB family protein n=1 Tax=uncultured Ilyobacter sp. TaxID=544433 RepID=UPI0029C7755C|nr:tripartite tricarboxylate transporter TctB family protein [uncultured Ilyobacter sp.]